MERLLPTIIVSKLALSVGIINTMLIVLYWERRPVQGPDRVTGRNGKAGLQAMEAGQQPCAPIAAGGRRPTLPLVLAAMRPARRCA